MKLALGLATLLLPAFVGQARAENAPAAAPQAVFQPVMQQLADACRKHARLLQLKLNGIEPGFVTQLQQALAGDALNEYIQHTGSAVFACPPGLRPGQHWGDTLFA